MGKILLKFIFLAIIIISPFFVQNALACQCRYIPTPYQSYKESSSVFVGKIISVKNSSGKEIIESDSRDSRKLQQQEEEQEEGIRFYVFEIQESFKGTKAKEITVAVEINMCQFGMSKGETYLVYADKSGGKSPDEILKTHLFCSRTREIKESQDDVYFLRELVKGKVEPRIYGSLFRIDKDSETGSLRYNYLEGIKIIAEREKRRFETVTDKNGLYRFYKLPNGKYKVYPKLPNKYDLLTEWFNLEEINLITEDTQFSFEYFKATGRNAYSQFQVDWNNEISGKVFDGEGKPVEAPMVKLIPLDQINKSLLESPYTENVFYKWKSEGDYKLSHFTPGKYVLAVDVFAPFITGKDKLRIYYPYTTDAEKAEVINLGESDKRTINIKLPAEFIVREIEGNLLWGSGYPIENGNISIEKLENSEDKNNVVYDSKRVEKGNFKFQVFENAEYWIHAKVYNEKSKTIKIKVGKTNIPLQVKISPLKSNQNQ